jgi:hypothetical protein
MVQDVLAQSGAGASLVAGWSGGAVSDAIGWCRCSKHQHRSDLLQPRWAILPDATQNAGTEERERIPRRADSDRNEGMPRHVGRSGGLEKRFANAFDAAFLGRAREDSPVVDDGFDDWLE